MIIAGLKLTGNGGIALLSDGRIKAASTLSVSGTNSSPDTLLLRVQQTLGAFRYRIDDIGAWVVDGWHGTTSSRLALRAGGVPVELALAGYLDQDPDPATRTGTLQLGDTTVPYVSYAHLSGHVAAAYCTSPFARDRAASAVLVWDGDSFPRLYHVDEAGRIESRGELFPLVGSVLTLAAEVLEPDRASDPPPSDAAAGLVDLAASGTVRADVTALVARLFDEHFEADTAQAKEYRSNVLGCGRSVDPAQRYTRAFLDELRQTAVDGGVRRADLAAALQLLLSTLLADRLTDLLDRSGTVDLCFTGSAALSPALTTALREHPRVRRLWVPPFPDDSGSAVGAAALHPGAGLRAVDWDLRLGPAPARSPHPPDGWSTSPCRPEELARLIHRLGRPVVVLRGQLYGGPGPLGSRTILAPAVEPAVGDRLNRATGRAEHRRATALCLRGHRAEVFQPETADPYAGYVHRLRPAWRSRLPVVTRPDGTARVRAVDDDPALRTILREYQKWSGVPVLAAIDDVGGPAGPLCSVDSAMRWGGIDLLWADGVLHRRGPLDRHDRTTQ